MPSSIRIKRICEYCGKEFEARTTVTRTCGKECAKRAYTARQKAGKIAGSHQQTQARAEIKVIERIKSKEFLTVRDAATLLNSSRQTIYNLIQTGVLPAVNISIKKTLIQRSAIDKLFTPQPVTTLTFSFPAKLLHLPLEDCYSLQEVREKYNVSDKTLYELIKRNAIPKQYKGKYAYVAKSRIDELLAGSDTQ